MYSDQKDKSDTICSCLSAMAMTLHAQWVSLSDSQASHRITQGDGECDQLDYLKYNFHKLGIFLSQNIPDNIFKAFWKASEQNPFFTSLLND